MSTADSHHAYPIHYAAQMNGANSGNNESKISEKVLKKFLDCKVRLDVVDDAGRQPLLWAACSGKSNLSLLVVYFKYFFLSYHYCLFFVFVLTTY